MSKINQEIKKCVEVIKSGGIILYPTDTVWGIGCNPFDENAVEKIYKLKKRPPSKSIILLVSNLEMLKNYTDDIPEKITLLSNEKPTTVIYGNPKKLPDFVLNEQDRSAAIRVVNDAFCKDLINTLGYPLVSTSANISGNPTPSFFSQIENEILHGVDYIVDLRREIETPQEPSRILKITPQGVQIIRN